MTGRHHDIDRLVHWTVSVPTDRIIYHQGEAPRAFYRVEAGCVRLQVNRPDGRRQILAFCLPGDVFGLEFADVRPMSAEAVAAARLTRFQFDPDGEEIAQTSMVGLLAAACEMSTILSLHLTGLGLNLAEERVTWFLDWLAGRQGVDGKGGPLFLPMNRQDISDFLGLAQETLSRTFARLEAHGAINVITPRRIVLRPRHSSSGPCADQLPNAA